MDKLPPLSREIAALVTRTPDVRRAIVAVLSKSPSPMVGRDLISATLRQSGLPSPTPAEVVAEITALAQEGQVIIREILVEVRSYPLSGGQMTIYGPPPNDPTGWYGITVELAQKQQVVRVRKSALRRIFHLGNRNFTNHLRDGKIRGVMTSNRHFVEIDLSCYEDSDQQELLAAAAQ